MKNFLNVFCFSLLFLAGCKKDEEAVITSIKIDKATLTIIIGETYLFGVDHLPVELKAPEYQWVSSNPQVVSVTSDGNITGTSIGNSTITATALDGTLKTSSIVTVIPIEATGITLNQLNASIIVGNTLLVTYVIDPPNTTNKDVEWSSDNVNIATVAEGTVTAVSPGIAKIKIKIKNTNKEAVCVVTVAPVEANSITLNKSDLSIKAGETSTLTYVIDPVNTTYKDVEWSSDNVNIAAVSDGIITAVAPGTANIKVKIKNSSKEAICHVVITPVAVTGVLLDQTNIQITNGTSTQLIPTVAPITASNKVLIWSSSNTNIASVSGGLVTAKSAGEVDVTVKTKDGSFTASCHVKVLPIAVNGISLNKATLSLVVDETSVLVATILPANAENKNVTWSSSNPSVATVDANGTVMTKALGKANITVMTSDGSYTAICNLSVVSITEKIELSLMGSYSSINGLITGKMYSSITNKSSLPITLTKFEIIDSNTNQVKLSTTDATKLGTLVANGSTNLGGNLSSVYQPIFKWYFTLNGVEYSVQHKDQ